MILDNEILVYYDDIDDICLIGFYTDEDYRSENYKQFKHKYSDLKKAITYICKKYNEGHKCKVETHEFYDCTLKKLKKDLNNFYSNLSGFFS